MMYAGLLAEFGAADEMLAALDALHEAGYRRLESYSPYAPAETDAKLGLRPSRLPWLAFAGGLGGAVIGYAIQWYANVWWYPQNVGGRPIHAVPSFIPVTFESAVIGAALAAVLGWLALLRFPQPWHPVFEIDGFDRASVDRFWVGIDAHDPRFDPERSVRALEALRPMRVVPLGVGT